MPQPPRPSVRPCQLDVPHCGPAWRDDRRICGSGYVEASCHRPSDSGRGPRIRTPAARLSRPRRTATAAALPLESAVDALQDDEPLGLGAVGTGPGFVVTAIRSGRFVDLRLLSPTNFSRLPQKPPPVPSAFETMLSALAPVSTIDRWLEVFMAMAGILCRDFPFKFPDLSEYALLISFAARTFSGNGWAAYDARFRQSARWTHPGALWTTICGS